MVSRMRQSCDPDVGRQGASPSGRGAALQARTVYLRVGHRLFVPLPVLYEHVRLSRDSRPGAGYRYRRQGGQSEAVGMAGDRRRRRAGDRRESFHPCRAAQYRHQYPAVQQRDLRTDQRAVLADLEAGQGDEDLAVRDDRAPVQSGRARARRAGHVLRAHDRRRAEPDSGVSGGRREARRDVGRGGIAELRYLQR